jgi:HSP20 family molecular chaperone IbpA
MGGSLVQAFELMNWFDSWFDNQTLSLDRYGKVYSSNLSSLPFNVYTLKDKKDLFFEIAVAGYDNKDVSVDFDGDYMIVSLASHKDSDIVNGPAGTTYSKSGKQYIVSGLKRGKCTLHYFVPKKFYNQDNTEANIENGILKITVPAEKKIETKRIEVKVR